ncbi:MAG: prepilin peptidase [Candidatus Thorarchaeota archaeon]
MVLDLSFASIMSFFTIVSLLLIYSILDIRDRRVRNEYIIAGGGLGCIILILSSHFVSDLILHVTAMLIVLPLAYILFRMGSIGGADVKSLLLVALISPGVQLRLLNIPILEAIFGVGVELLIMLTGGYLYWRIRMKNENASPPLIPFLLLGYLAIQLIALF